MAMSHTGRRNPERYLIKMECQDHRPDDLHDKDFVRQTIIELAQKSYDDQGSEKTNLKRILDYLKPSGYFQGQANLHTRNVTRCHYNTQSKVAFNQPQDTQTLCGEESLLNKRINDYTQIPSMDYQDKTYKTVKVFPHLKGTDSNQKIVIINMKKDPT